MYVTCIQMQWRRGYTDQPSSLEGLWEKWSGVWRILNGGMTKQDNLYPVINMCCAQGLVSSGWVSLWTDVATSSWNKPVTSYLALTTTSFLLLLLLAYDSTHRVGSSKLDFKNSEVVHVELTLRKKKHKPCVLVDPSENTRKGHRSR